MIFYFTGTGNSLWAANETAQKLGENLRNITAISDNEYICDDMVGLVCPIYMLDLPWIVKKQLLKIKISPDAYTFGLFTSSMGKSGKAAESADKIFCSAEGKLSAYFDISMPGNCITSSKEQNEKRLQDAPSEIEKILNQIKSKTQNYASKGKKAEKDFVERSFFYKNNSLLKLSFMKRFEITNDCDGCGLCGKICPTNNITIENGKACHSQNCAACYACLHWCHKNATKLKVPILHNRFQYRHPSCRPTQNGIALK